MGTSIDSYTLPCMTEGKDMVLNVILLAHGALFLIYYLTSERAHCIAVKHASPLRVNSILGRVKG